MKQLRSPIVWRLILWFLLLSLVPIGIVLVFIQRDVQETTIAMLAEDILEETDILAAQIARQPDQMQAIVQDFSLHDKTPFVLNADGLYTAHAQINKVGQDARNDFAEAELINQILASPGQLFNLNEERLLVGTQPGTGGQVIVMLENTDVFSEIFSGLTRQVTFRLIISLIIISLVSGAAILTVTNPLSKLADYADQLSAGQLDAQLDSAELEGEIATLAVSLGALAQSVKSSIGGLEQSVADRTQALMTVAEVTSATSAILETNRLLQAAVDLTKERFGLYHSHIYLLDETKENLMLAAGAGEPGRVMVAEKRFIPLNRERSLVARAARERQGVVVNDVTQEPDFLPNPLLPETRAELAVPMLAGADLIGVFDIQSEQVGRFTESDIAIQTTLAAQIATSVQNARFFEGSKAQAELEAQINLIAQKVHSATTLEETLQIAIRELGSALGATRVSAKIGQSLPPEAAQPGLVE